MRSFSSKMAASALARRCHQRTTAGAVSLSMSAAGLRSFATTARLLVDTTTTTTNNSTSTTTATAADPVSWYHVAMVSDPRKPIVVEGKLYTQQQCFILGLEQDPHRATAWAGLGVSMIDSEGAPSADSFDFYSKPNPHVVVNGDAVSPVQCFKKALELDPKVAVAWDVLGVLIGAASNGRVSAGHMPVFINISRKNYTAIDCFAKAIESFVPANDGTTINNTAMASSARNLTGEFLAPAAWWANFALAISHRQMEMEAVSGGAEEGYDVKKRIATGTINGVVYDALKAYAAWAHVDPSAFVAWYNIASLLSHEEKVAMKAFIEQYNVWGEGEAVGDSNVTAPVLPKAVTVTVGDEQLTLKQVIARSIESLGGDIVTATAAWVQLGNCLADEHQRSEVSYQVELNDIQEGDEEAISAAAASARKPPKIEAIVNGKPYSMIYCFAMAAKGAEYAVSQQNAELPAESLRSFANIWHTLGAHLRPGQKVQMEFGSAAAGTLKSTVIDRLGAFERSAELTPNSSTAWYNMAIVMDGPSEKNVTVDGVVNVRGGEEEGVVEEEPMATVLGKKYTRAQCFARSIECFLAENSGNTAPVISADTPAGSFTPLEERFGTWAMLGTHLLAVDSIREELVQAELQKAVNAVIKKMQERDASGADGAGVEMPPMPQIPTVIRSTVKVGTRTVSAASCFVSSLEARIAADNVKASIAAAAADSSTVGPSIGVMGLQATASWTQLGQILMNEDLSEEASSERNSTAKSATPDDANDKDVNKDLRDAAAAAAAASSVRSNASVFITGLSEHPAVGPLDAAACYARAVECDPASPDTWAKCAAALYYKGITSGKLDKPSASAGGSNATVGADRKKAQQQQQQAYQSMHAVIDGKSFSILDCRVKALALAPADPQSYGQLAAAMELAGVEKITVDGVPCPSSTSATSAEEWTAAALNEQMTAMMQQFQGLMGMEGMMMQ